MKWVIIALLVGLFFFIAKKYRNRGVDIPDRDLVNPERNQMDQHMKNRNNNQTPFGG
jgi:hypothetical protein